MVGMVRDWLIAAWEFIWGILRHFYVWVAPFVILQPIDLLDKLGLHLVIPNDVVYGLVALGLFVSAIDVFKASRDRVASLAADAHAREVAGSVFMEPAVFAYVDAASPNQAQVQGAVRIHNRGSRAVQYTVLERVVTINGVTTEAGPTTPLTLSPSDNMDERSETIGPFPVNADLPVTVMIRYAYGQLFSRSLTEEQKTFTFHARVDGHGSVSVGPWAVEEKPRQFGIILFHPTSKSAARAAMKGRDW
jgi:hypothetical protein